MQHISHSEAGHEHVNEDAVAAKRHPRDENALICVLADGQGGQFGGGVAARLAVETCLNLALKREVEELLQNETWSKILCHTDEIVEADANAGFTTLIGLCVTPTRVCGASCGDSAALLIDAENLIELSENQRKNPPIGSGSATPVSFLSPRVPASQLSLMSDGVWKFVGFEAIRVMARQQRGANLVFDLRQLQLDGNNGKLTDDFSLIVVE